MTSRAYTQRARAEKAAATRTAIIEAVFESLRESPTEPVAVDRIARAAGVARSTVYATFGSRAGLFDAVGFELAQRSGYDRLLEAKHHPTARGYLRAGHKHRALVPLRLPGQGARAFRAGANLAPDHAVGRRSWEEFLAKQVG